MAASVSVFLNVNDIQKSLDFYQKLGFRVARSYKDDAGAVTYADLKMGGAELGLGSIASNDEASFREWVSTPLGAGVLVYVTLPNVDKVYEKAKAAGATIETALTDRSYGRLFMLNDPDGYSISFIKEKPVAKRAAKKVATKAKKVAKKGAKTAKKAAKGAKKAAKKRVSGARTRR